MEGIEKKKTERKTDNKAVSKLLSLSEPLDNLKENIILAGTSWNVRYFAEMLQKFMTLRHLAYLRSFLAQVVAF